MSKNYRKLYENHHKCCLLPGVDIHHIDGDHDNNDLINLRAVTLQEHFDIHYSQGDYYAAFMIGLRMKIPPKEWTEAAKRNGSLSGTALYQSGGGMFKWHKENPELSHQMAVANGKKNSVICRERGTGLFGIEPEKKKQIASLGGQAAAEMGLGFKLGHAQSAGSIGGKTSGELAKKNKTGIFNLSPEKNRQRIYNSQATWAIKSGRASEWPRRETR